MDCVLDSTFNPPKIHFHMLPLIVAVFGPSKDN